MTERHGTHLQGGSPAEDAPQAWLLALASHAERQVRREEKRAADLRRGPDGHLPPIERARTALERLRPRAKRYLKSAGELVAAFRHRRGLTEAEALTLRGEVLAAWWRAKHGLEFRFLVALVLAPELAPEVFDALRPADFESVPYAALFAAWREYGLPAPDDLADLLEGRGYVPASPPRAAEAPHLSAAWWAIELRATLAELLERRRRRIVSTVPAACPRLSAPPP